MKLVKPNIDQSDKNAVLKHAKEEKANKEDHIIFEVFSSQSLGKNNCLQCGWLYDSTISNFWTIDIACDYDHRGKEHIVKF